ncbi:hypothetical protein DPMN_141152 [Dreissena polymorpha]|uniref:Uncharacterized protein n=1 Tax=Dreissena polymorpha TaxID=45954 RepID=A0A9D4GCT1_DREPO|nr:hypothetical protein DPMN_141123 [Dreissena polymorpha]KAH3812714.1 hypothetical protein DPMN_141152 [Dreissena polymorpha]
MDARLPFSGYWRTWKKALDSNQYVAAILMDLSKAFDWPSTVFHTTFCCVSWHPMDSLRRPLILFAPI